MVIVTHKSVLELMQDHTLTRFDGEPTHKISKKLKKELGCNLIAVPCPWSLNKGYVSSL